MTCVDPMDQILAIDHCIAIGRGVDVLLNMLEGDG